MSSFQGLSRQVWILALISFVNRAGTMVLPFLSLYLTASLGLTLGQVGWIMTAFGLGSTFGSWMGGKMTDKFGFYPVMISSLIGGGIMFLILQMVNTFVLFCVIVFILTSIADIFRPASFVAVKAYSEEKDTTRAVTLIRLAINLGFSFAPAIGGLIIVAIGYKALFIIDGVTCMMAGLMAYFLLPATGTKTEASNPLDEIQNSQSKRGIYRDKPYMLFLIIMFIYGFVFIQLFANVPLFYRDVHHLTEEGIGWLMALNGLMIFFLEMPLVHGLEKKGIPIIKIITFSALLVAVSFFVLNVGLWIGVLIIGMILITLGEMLAFPFTNTFALSRSSPKLIGRYMGLYSMSFSLSHIFGPNIGLQLVERFGFAFCWNAMGILTLIATTLCIYLNHLLQKEKHSTEV